MNINNAAVNACQAIGIGHTQLAELSGFLDLPALSSTGFLRVQTEVAEIVHATAWDEMKKAGEEERRLAIESGSLDLDGYQLLQWSRTGNGPNEAIKPSTMHYQARHQ
ncbi:unnamed protein product [Macrosiphum euphorbiae]|uniref:Mutator-like transposase domain-containing protein n=1 Tax=Macrosiphum euphorbiae TaxID=13131 RepID=A0AAV0Y7L5_9HEMI|nr:unnamed protein product [Macrosiphum euphorbiae]